MRTRITPNTDTFYAVMVVSDADYWLDYWLFNKAAVLKACNFIKMRLRHKYLPMNIAKILRTPILKNICEQQLLLIISCLWVMTKIMIAFKSFLVKQTRTLTYLMPLIFFMSPENIRKPLVFGYFSRSKFLTLNPSNKHCFKIFERLHAILLYQFAAAAN